MVANSAVASACARRAGYRDGVARPARLCRSLPRRDLDPPCRGGADADGAVNDGATVAPVTRPANLQRLPRETRASGETDASITHAVVAPGVAVQVNGAFETALFASAALPFPHEKPARFARGTGGSNPVRSRGESIGALLLYRRARNFNPLPPGLRTG